MSKVIRLADSYPVYEVDLDLNDVKATMVVHKYTTYTIFKPVNGAKQEVPGASSFVVENSGEGKIHVNEVRNRNGRQFPSGAVFESLDGRVFFRKSYLDEQSGDDD